MKKFLIIAIIFTSLAAFVSCGGKGNAETAKAEETHEDEHANINTATLSEEQIKSIGIELGTIEEKQLTAS